MLEAITTHPITTTVIAMVVEIRSYTLALLLVQE